LFNELDGFAHGLVVRYFSNFGGVNQYCWWCFVLKYNWEELQKLAAWTWYFDGR